MVTVLTCYATLGGARSVLRAPHHRALCGCCGHDHDHADKKAKESEHGHAEHGHAEHGHADKKAEHGHAEHGHAEGESKG